MSARKTILLSGRVFLTSSAIMLAFLLPKVATAQIVADHLVISEIQTGVSGTGNSQKDFIEIYNPTDSDIDLNGHRLVKRTKSATTDTTIKSWTSATIIPAKSYYLWANSNYAELAHMANATTTQSIADDNAIALRLGPEDTGVIIDAVAWGENTSGLGEGSNFPQNIPDDQSLERISETDDNSVDFIIQQSPTPTGLSSSQTPPGQTPGADEEDQTGSDIEQDLPANPTPPSSGGNALVNEPVIEIYLSEILPNPQGLDSGREWVELYNNSNFDVNIGGWILDDDIGLTPGNRAYKLPADSIISAKSYKAILIPQGRFALNNNDDIVRLFNNNLVLVDQISYQGPAKEGESFAKNNSGLWQWTTALTPDTANQFVADATGGETEVAQDDKYKDVAIVFNEVFGNPEGADAGQEWVELLNRGAEEVDLSGWYLDDDGTTVSSNAYRLPSGSIIPSLGLLLVNLPEESSFITNTEETLRLISPDRVERVQVFTPEIPQGQSFARKIDSEEWELSALPTPGEPNKFVSEPKEVIISEVYYKPAEDEEDFIELYNRESDWVDLSGWKITAGDSEYNFPKGSSLAPRSYLLLMGEMINLRINDSNIDSLQLLRPDGLVQDSWEFKSNIESAQTGYSLIVVNNAVIATNSPTPGQNNKRTNRAATRVRPAAVSVNTAAPLNLPVVAGDVAPTAPSAEHNSAINFSNEQELPIIIEKNENSGFFHRLRRFFCAISFGVLKC